MGIIILMKTFAIIALMTVGSFAVAIKDYPIYTDSLL